MRFIYFFVALCLCCNTKLAAQLERDIALKDDFSNYEASDYHNRKSLEHWKLRAENDNETVSTSGAYSYVEQTKITPDGTVGASIGLGSYAISHFAYNKDDIYPIPVEVLPEEDFSIDIDIEIFKETFDVPLDSQSVGLVLKGTKTNLYFLLGHDRKFLVFRDEKMSNVPYIDWTTNGAILGQWRYNAMSIRKEGEQLYFSFNKEQVHAEAIAGMQIESAGFFVGRGAAMQVSFIEIIQKPPIVVMDMGDKVWKKEPLGLAVNTNLNELNPILSKEEDMLFYVYDDPEAQQIYSVEQDEKGIWNKVTELDYPFNDSYNNACIWFSNVSKEAFVAGHYEADDYSTASGGISKIVGKLPKKKKKKSNLEQVEWQKPEGVPIKGYDNWGTLRAFFLNKDQSILIISSQMEICYGEQDLYVSFEKGGKYTEPINLGKQINTYGRESSAFLMPDRRTLYFSSDGLPGYGERDIFVAYRLDKTWQNWSEPQNLGPMINSPLDEDDFYPMSSGDEAFLSATNPENGSLDIFRAFLAPDTLVIDIPLVDTLVVVNEEVVKEDAIAKTFDRGVEEIVAGQLFRLDGVEFNADAYDLRKGSEAVLDQLVTLLDENPSVVIEIGGHTNGLPPDDYCDELSMQRARTIVRYLKRQGISADRLVAKGYGKRKPIADNQTPEGRTLNQRVEFRVLEK